MSTFVTVFEISKGSTYLPLLILGIGIIVFLFGFLLFILRYFYKHRFKISYFTSYIIVFIGAFFLIATTSDLLADYRFRISLYEVYLNEQYEIVEGTVKVLRTQPKAGHAPGDLIEINENLFEIDACVFSPAYDKTISHGGVLNNGVYARIYHFKGKILRVDIVK